MPNNLLLRTFGTGLLIGSSTAYVIYKLLRIIHRVTESDLEECRRKIVYAEYNVRTLVDGHQIVFGIQYDPSVRREIYAIQCSHAAVALYARIFRDAPKDLQQFINDGSIFKTICLDTKEQMLNLQKKASQKNVTSTVILDTHSTQVPPGVRAVMAIGPAPKAVLDEIIGNYAYY